MDKNSLSQIVGNTYIWECYTWIYSKQKERIQDDIPWKTLTWAVHSH